MSKDILTLKQEEYLLIQRKKRMQDCLPHLYGYKWYRWARRFYESTNRTNLLCAANQISKSSTQIRKCIDWATSPDKWGKLWKTRPQQFWYLYPTLDTCDIEFYKKWVPEFMPREELRTHPQYGWVDNKEKGKIHDVTFNTGVTIYFKTYAQDVKNLQTNTVHAIFADEELPVEYYDELLFRMAATDGYFHMVFTATLGQEFWFNALEKRGTRFETLPDAYKDQVSMYDCLTYEDGTETPWTMDKIHLIKKQCKSEAEILRRVYGRFIKDEGLKYPTFVKERNLVPSFKFGRDWHIYSGVDIGAGGSGGRSTHPAAIVFVAVRPDYKFGAVFKGWIGHNEVTTASDILDKYRLLRGTFQPIIQSYDYASVDFSTYAHRLGESFTKAQKSHALGEDIINVLFKNGMLVIFDIEELNPLVAEILSVNKETLKRQAKDDFIDALRYAVTPIPWDWSAITNEYTTEKAVKEEKLSETQKRRKFVFEDDYRRSELSRIEDEIEDYNALLQF